MPRHRPAPGGPPTTPPGGPPTIPPGQDRVDPEPPGKQRAADRMRSFVANERGQGRPRPNRNAIEAHIRNAEGFTRRELNAHLVEIYDDAAGLGVLRAR